MKNAQIQIGETIAVLFVFFILITIGFIFYSKVIRSNIEIEKDELSQLQSIAAAQKVLFMPELQCSEENIIVDSCIDLMKLRALSRDTIRKENELHYYDLFGFSSIEITQAYPSQPGAYILYSKPLAGARSKFVTNIPMGLYDAADRTRKFGILKIETFIS
ncbi:hypothetical protein HYS31_00535 [Candidatus Woesearchaeota archaeon]|nr:hypothetical protein [Candidatus Woesearchaeota archaeon]